MLNSVVYTLLSTLPTSLIALTGVWRFVLRAKVECVRWDAGYRTQPFLRSGCWCEMLRVEQCIPTNRLLMKDDEEILLVNLVVTMSVCPMYICILHTYVSYAASTGSSFILTQTATADDGDDEYV